MHSNRIEATHRRTHRSVSIALAAAVLLAQFAPSVASAAAAETPAPMPTKQYEATFPPPPYGGKLPSLAAVNIRDGELERVLGGLRRPRAFEFLSADEVIITEIGGRLLRHRLGSGRVVEITGLPTIATGHDQTGLLDVEVHPQFSSNRRIYFSYSAPDAASGRYYLTAVATATLGDDRLEGLEVIVEAGPHGWSPSNFGGALEFDAAGFLYVTIGDRSESDLAQDGRYLQGKVLRLHADGSVPADNPFRGDDAIDDRIFAFGVRNPQGLHFDAASGHLFESEHGPLGGDEVNLIEAGGNYGWPIVTYGLNYTTKPIGIGTHAPGMRQPVYYYLPSIATSPLTVYRGTMFPEWEGDLLVGALRGQHVSWIDLDGTRVRAQTPILGELRARIRDLKVSADGALFVLAETGDLYRLARRAQAEPDQVLGNDVLYAVICSGCHDTGAHGAPDPSKPEQWTAIRAQSVETVHRHVIEGKGAMPPRGLCVTCPDEQLKAITDYMLERSAGDDDGKPAH